MKKLVYTLFVALCVVSYSCEEFEKYELPESNSIADNTPPSAQFSAIQGVGLGDAFRTYTFSNGSVSATTYSWSFPDGSTSTEFEPMYVFAGEGTFSVSLTASDELGVTSTSIQDVVVVMPAAPPTPDPTLVNASFDKIAKSSGSDCACAGWINRGLGDQGESSTASGDDVLKFDNQEPDHIYQEFEVVGNADYLVTVDIRFSNLSGGTAPSDLEFRILAGTGYDSGYTPVYYTDTAVMPQGNSSTGLWGYTSVPQMENAANNLNVRVFNTPGNDSFATYTFNFNAGANNSVALFARGIGGAAGGNYGYNSGDAEIRIDNLIIEAIN